MKRLILVLSLITTFELGYVFGVIDFGNTSSVTEVYRSASCGHEVPEIIIKETNPFPFVPLSDFKNG